VSINGDGALDGWQVDNRDIVCRLEMARGGLVPVKETFYIRAGKRWLDAACSFGGIIILSPLLCAAAMAIRLTSAGPVFFRQTRIGRHGKPFRIFKFRTMVASNAPGAPLLTASGDPRVTRVGCWLRATKVDELAQLFNVLKGEMSLVGPRPEIPEYVAAYTERQKLVLAMKPGITGPATRMDEEELLVGQTDQSQFYATVILPAKLKTDLAYSENVRCSTDLKLIFRTIAKVAGKIVETFRAPLPMSQFKT
jgi:lipopolysaccharide/colanic/teichoic acid biosynthesis glycosyltransferase